MVYCTDVDLLHWEPNIFRDALFASQLLISGTGNLAGTSFTLASGSLTSAHVVPDEVMVLSGALAGSFPITRQAVVKHLTALGEAGLVEGERDGREVRYRLTPGPLNDAVGWMTAVGAEWDERLARLRAQLEGGSSPRRRRSSRS